MCYVWLLIIVFFQNSLFGNIARFVKITNPPRTDGFGAQFQTIIASAIFAELNNFEFVYTPFQKMEHNYDNDPDYLTKKEELIKFLENFDTSTDTDFSLCPNCLIKFFEGNIEACSKSSSLKRIKKIFRSNKKYWDYFDTSFNIAIHIRRPNLHDSREGGTDIPNAVFLEIISTLRDLYSSLNPVFHIYSQGIEENFIDFESEDTILHLNETVEETFSALVFADVLVTSPSSFSYSAALLSNGTVYYIPFWHLPLPDWKSVQHITNSKNTYMRKAMEYIKACFSRVDRFLLRDF